MNMPTPQESKIIAAKKKAMAAAKKFGGMAGDTVKKMMQRDKEMKRQMDELGKY